MVASVKWNDYSEVLVAIADTKLAVWYYPSVVFVDRDLLPRVRVIREDAVFGRHDQLIDFCGSRCTVRRGADGACLTFAVRPYPIMLFGHTTKQDWNSAVRLCRFVKSDCMWAILAAVSVKAGELETAQTAYAAVNEVDKLQYMNYIGEVPAQARAAEFMLFQRRPEEAEKILVQAGLIYRAIRMHIQLFNWDKALELAVKHRTHVDTTLWFRKKFLQNFNKEETDPKFLTPEILAVEVDPEKVTQKREQEREKEKQMQR
jgi:intraflagellar transport protein 80